MGRDEIRPTTLCAVERDGEILVQAYTDPTTNERFYRPLGGGIEFGEHSSTAIVREFREELDIELVGLNRLGVIENRFTFAGETGHELVVVYDGTFEDETLYERETLNGYEESSNTAFEAFWKPLADFPSEDRPLYPEGLLELLIEEL